jgi:hypothetical protein
VAGRATFLPGGTRLFGRPFMRRPLFVGSLPAFAGDAPLLVAIHRRKSAILFCHTRMVRASDSVRQNNSEFTVQFTSEMADVS